MTEYIERKTALMKIMQDGCSASNIAVLMSIPSADVAPVRREKVEKEWRGRWITVYSKDEKWSKCCNCQNELNDLEDGFFFCPICGDPMTDEGVETMMERLETLKDADTDH